MTLLGLGRDKRKVQSKLYRFFQSWFGKLGTQRGRTKRRCTGIWRSTLHNTCSWPSYSPILFCFQCWTSLQNFLHSLQGRKDCRGSLAWVTLQRRTACYLRIKLESRLWLGLRILKGANWRTVAALSRSSISRLHSTVHMLFSPGWRKEDLILSRLWCIMVYCLRRIRGDNQLTVSMARNKCALLSTGLGHLPTLGNWGSKRL
jgi:hypothetical protein